MPEPRPRSRALRRIGRRVYETADGRFLATWAEKQGARSCYQVFDRQAGRTLRAFDLGEIREAIAEMRAESPDAPDPVASPAVAVDGGPRVAHRVVLALDDADEWYVQSVPIRRVDRDGAILLARPFRDLGRVRYPTAALGSHFFSSAEEALRAFGRWQYGAIERSDRMRAEAQRGLTWLARQLGGEDARARPDRGRRAAFRRGRPVGTASAAESTGDAVGASPPTRRARK